VDHYVRVNTPFFDGLDDRKQIWRITPILNFRETVLFVNDLNGPCHGGLDSEISHAEIPSKSYINSEPIGQSLKHSELKIIPVRNKAQHHDSVWWRGGITVRFLNLGSTLR
jgi:hypothetical protein